MNRLTVEKKLHSLSDRISRAYYDYGHLCAAHTISCLSICILSMIILSYPSLAQIKLPISSPMDIYWMEKDIELNENITINKPEWLLLEPAVYFQQIIVQGHVDPWNNLNMTPKEAIKGPISRSFDIIDHILSTKLNNLKNFDDICFKVKTKPNSSIGNYLPSKNCLYLSPTLFWNNDKLLFLEDDNIINTIFQQQCTNQMCLRDILLGIPTRLTGIKQNYQTNRHRSIEYSITIIQNKYDKLLRNELINNLNKEFDIIKSKSSDESIFVHVFYRPRKYFTDYFPLFAGYFLCMTYFYYTVSKFEMVKSKWGLAFAAFNTVFWTLAMTSGICAHFDLTPTLWGAGLYPYLAMIIGLENILCITRSVAFTLPTMDVSSRLAHGLSHEGYNITKFFLLEMSFLGLAWLTFVQEIQEFCTFAFIALVVDFYMQLFFYIPCLLFDLGRLEEKEKQKFSQMLFKSDIKKLKNYPIPKCPMRLIFPLLFKKKSKLLKTLSENQLNMLDDESNIKKYKRTYSTDKMIQFLKEDTPISIRLRVLYFWTRTRFIQRIIMFIFIIWVLWLAFIVHKLKLFNINNNNNINDNNIKTTNSFLISKYILDTAPLQWVQYQRQTFKWWPAVFNEYNLSLSGHYVTFLPPIVINTKISPDDWSLQYIKKKKKITSIKGNINDGTVSKEPELQSRITFLERQMTTLLFLLMFLPFCFVVAFITYVFIWDKWRQYRTSLIKTQNVDPPKTLSQKCFVELTPLLFSNHDIVVECVSIQLPSTVMFTTLDSRVYICGFHSAEAKQQLLRWRNIKSATNENTIRNRTVTMTSKDVSNEIKKEGRTRSITENENSQLSFTTGDSKSQIWSMAVKQDIILLGCADGSVELASRKYGKVIGKYEDSSLSGIIQINIKGNRMIVGRLNGIIDVIEMIINETGEISVDFNLLNSIHAHQRPITSVICAGLHVFTSSYDRLIKIFDVRTMRIIHTLIEDESPVVEMKVDEQIDAPLVLYNMYESGLICCWDVESGELIRSLNELQKNGIKKAKFVLTSKFLASFSEDGQLFMWDKINGNFIIRLVAKDSEKSFDETSGEITVLEDELVATSLGRFVQIWDLNLKALIRQIQLPNSVEKIYSMGSRSILCVASNTIYRVDVPTFGFRKDNQ